MWRQGLSLHTAASHWLFALPGTIVSESSRRLWQISSSLKRTIYRQPSSTCYGSRSSPLCCSLSTGWAHYHHDLHAWKRVSGMGLVNLITRQLWDATATDEHVKCFQSPGRRAVIPRTVSALILLSRRSQSLITQAPLERFKHLQVIRNNFLRSIRSFVARKCKPRVVRLVQEASGNKKKNGKQRRFHETGVVSTDCVSVCVPACCSAPHIWSRPENQRLRLSNTALRFPNLRQLATVSRRWFIGWREGHFPSQSHRTFMVCSHPNLPLNKSVPRLSVGQRCLCR